MLYNHLLPTFLCVADCGSMTKAAQQLFLTPTAVMKQINLLEKQLNLKLFLRTNQGIMLTECGQSIYKDAKCLIAYAQKAVEKAKDIEGRHNEIIQVGTSMLNPCKVFMDIWYRLNERFPQYKIKIIPFEDDHNGILSVIEKIGQEFDFIVGVCDSAQWLDRCNFYQLGDLELHHSQIHIEDAGHFYDIQVFNRCEQTGNVLLNLECWKDIHPSLVTIPVDWDYAIPFGLLYPLHPSKKVLNFLKAVSDFLNMEKAGL